MSVQGTDPSTDPVNNLLSQMRPLHLPESIDSWPWAPGWYVLIAFFLVATILASYLLLKHRHHYLFRRQALKELEQINDAYQRNPESRIETAQKLSALYRRLALTQFPRSRVSQLTGEQWLAFLDTFTDSHFFTEQEGQLLGNQLFKKPEESNKQKSDMEILLQESESMIKKLKLKGEPS